MARPVRNRKRPKYLESQAKIVESEEEVDSSADPALSADRDLEYNPPPATLSKSAGDTIDTSLTPITYTLPYAFFRTLV
jgi:hypothetical protein